MLLSALVLSLAGPARADVVTLQNGVKMQGIVISSTTDGLDLQVGTEGHIFLDPESVVSVQMQSALADDNLVNSWRDDSIREQQAARDEEAYTRSQEAKGLIYYEGEWLTPAAMDRKIEVERLAIEREKLAQGPAPAVVINIDNGGYSDSAGYAILGVPSYRFYNARRFRYFSGHSIIRNPLRTPNPGQIFFNSGTGPRYR